MNPGGEEYWQFGVNRLLLDQEWGRSGFVNDAQDEPGCNQFIQIYA